METPLFIQGIIPILLAPRLLAFVVALAAMLAWEGALPRRMPLAVRPARRMNNLVLVVIGTGLVRLVPFTSAVAAAAWAGHTGTGVLRLLSLPPWVELVVAVVLLDLAVYAQHRVFHLVPVLWRLHRVHHTDREVDTTTGVRFHPLELVVSALYKAAIVVLLGAPAAAVVIFEILLNVSSLFSHGNVAIPARFDTLIRRVLVTPDMHRVHHSVLREETDSNFGFCLSAWDRLFGSYRAQPRDGHDGMRIGLVEFSGRDVVGTVALLRQPLVTVADRPAGDEA